MALKKCDECGGDLSTTATKCPHCGAERMSTTQGVCACLCFLGIIIFLLILFF
ncbi:MAG: hypothetical protein KKF16_08970 [Euryarchaeota archaeon]|nr:hypothetical protein [Euryarchaeota archaeon]MBV1728857.1 hypothetical protein [Methanobacterium sp.]MBU4547860.1 hypothetical protein [Euryarchaeota archaeon]MBU4607579.1 hypothetical protein [Euryarchaeota archaeon]MBV1754868.1 hypothetical protein [Methanobacterium sp.]